ncbi:hypothetical protein GCM10025876_31940 [Demequina litorisediminis]|uniref:DUF2795 domain-containing protein n=2 Tax=Demequina litorisediminis TaxID=1849022 RepID=A0ABQ6II54_9MICO|nr:hypothetical protein GCM10025876_31940 [Demequina litorisediminis]
MNVTDEADGTAGRVASAPSVSPVTGYLGSRRAGEGGGAGGERRAWKTVPMPDTSDLVLGGLTPDEAEREIYQHILSRNPEHDFEPTLDRVREACELLGDPQSPSR